MELVVVIAVIVGVAWLASMPARRYEKRTGKKLGRDAAASMMNVVNELYLPSAANSAQILSEQKEQRTAIPSAADKPFDGGTITIVVPDKT